MTMHREDPPPSAHALIIGGGIAGPVTAMALHKAGIGATVYEAYDRTADGIGAFLTLAGNGLEALRLLNLHDLINGAGFATPRFRFLSRTGRPLGHLDRPSDRHNRTLLRADLYRALRDEAVARGIPIEYGKRLVDAQRTRHGVRARFADGTAADGSLLIGADGLHSRTRRLIDPKAPCPRYVGLLNTGGYARGIEVPDEPGELVMIFGKKCFFSYTLAPDGQIWWFANPGQAQQPTQGELAAITEQQWRLRLIELLRVDDTLAVDVINATERILPGWGTYDLPSVPTWHDDRMIIVGDAAHAASPASGQGASMAIEDAVELAICLRDLPAVSQAFAAYESRRRARVERVVRQGKRSGDQKAVGPVARAVRDAMMPMFLRWMNSHDPLAWMHGYRIDWDQSASAASSGRQR